MEIKVGDKVLAMETAQIIPPDKAYLFRRNVSLVTSVKDGIASLYFIDRYGGNHHARTAVELCKKAKDVENPTEDKNSLSAPESVETLQILSEEEHLRNLSQSIEICDKLEQYTADLAKEIAVKLAGRDVRPPKELGEYAVKVAKAVVAGLRKGDGE